MSATAPETVPETAAAQPETQRNEKGQFKFDNIGGPGNPFARKVAAIRKDFIEFSTTQRITALVSKLYDQAMEGCVASAKVFLSYAIGKPQPAVDPDRLDIEEWQQYRDMAPMKQEYVKLAETGAPKPYLHFLRTIRPILGEIVSKELRDMWQQTPQFLADQKRAAEERKRAAAERLNRPGPELPDGLEKQLWPSTNGNFEELPSALGNGAPSTNGMREQKLRSKARRQAKKQAKSAANDRF